MSAPWSSPYDSIIIRTLPLVGNLLYPSVKTNRESHNSIINGSFMHENSVILEIEKAEIIAKELISSAVPNNIIDNYSYENQIYICKEIYRLRDMDFNSLIGGVETILRRIEIPDIENSVADHDVLIFKSRIGQIIYCLNRVSANARSCGYFDPYASGAQISASLYKKELDEIIEKLEFVRMQLDILNSDVAQYRRDDVMSGISIGIGPVSADISTLKKYVNKGLQITKLSNIINSNAMKGILSSIQKNAVLLYDKFKNKLYDYGERTTSTILNIAIASSDAFKIGLQIIKKSISKNISDIEKVDSLYNEVVSNIMSILLENNIKSKLENNEYNHPIGYIYTYTSIVRGVYTLTMEKVFVDEETSIKKNISVGYFGITKHQYDIFNSIGAERLSRITHDIVYGIL